MWSAVGLPCAAPDPLVTGAEVRLASLKALRAQVRCRTFDKMRDVRLELVSVSFDVSFCETTKLWRSRLEPTFSDAWIWLTKCVAASRLAAV